MSRGAGHRLRDRLVHTLAGPTLRESPGNRPVTRNDSHRSRAFGADSQHRLPVADAMTLPLPARHFDCIVSIGTLHHLPLGEMLARMKAALVNDGVLLVLDLFAPEGPMDAIRNTIAMPLSVGKRFLRTGRLKPPRAVRKAWADHGRHDSYSTLTEVREICADVLPGAKIRKHLLWRYSIVWKKITD